MSKDKVDKFYVSEDTKFLREWDAAHPEKSLSQIAEIQKHERIFKLRDKPKKSEATPSVK